MEDRPLRPAEQRLVAELRDRGALTRAELATRTALPKTTVAGLVTRLVDAGVLVETAPERAPAARAGRPAARVALAVPGAVAVIAHSHMATRVAVLDPSGRILLRRETLRTPGDRIAAGLALLQSALTEHRATARADAAGSDAGRADVGRVDAWRADLGRADGAGSDVGDSAAGGSDAGGADAGRADGGRPDVARPDVARPDVSRAATAGAGAWRVDMGRADVAGSDAWRVDVGRADMGGSDAGCADGGRADGGRSDAARPGVSGAGVSGADAGGAGVGGAGVEVGCVVTGVPVPFRPRVGTVPVYAHRSAEQRQIAELRDELGGFDGDPTERVRARFGVPALTDNDANLGALGEAAFGAGRGLGSFVYVKIVEGIGAALVLDGRIHRGASGMAGELAHVHVQDDGPLCVCGARGCLVTRFEMKSMLQTIQAAYRDPVGFDEVAALAAHGDTSVRRVLGDLGRTLGAALADLCVMLDPAGIVLDGMLGRAAEPVAEGIREAVDRRTPPIVSRAVRVLPSPLGDRAELLGAVALAHARI